MADVRDRRPGIDGPALERQRAARAVGRLPRCDRLLDAVPLVAVEPAHEFGARRIRAAP